MRSLIRLSLSLFICCVSADDSTLFKSELSDSRHLLRHQTKPNSIEDKTLLAQTSDTSYYIEYNEFVTIENGEFGEWQEKKYMNDGYYACGMAIRDEAGQGWGDDSSNNAIKIISCHKNNWNVQSSVLLNEGLWGSWKPDVMCPYKTYINGVRVKYEEYVRGADNTGMNGLEIKCKGFSFGSSTVKLDYGGWGKWREWTEFPDRYVCGGVVKFQRDQGSQDDTALNGLALKFCRTSYSPADYTIIENGIWGDWLENMEAPVGYIGCGMAVRYQADQGSEDDTTLNAVKIIYCETDLRDGYELNQGIYGDWKVDSICPLDTFIYSIRVKSEKPRGSGVAEPYDDTALSGIQFKCKYPKLENTQVTDIILDYGNRGEWGKWFTFEDSFLCGGQVRMDLSEPSEDETGVNGIRFKFCKFIGDDYPFLSR